MTESKQETSDLKEIEEREGAESVQDATCAEPAEEAPSAEASTDALQEALSLTEHRLEAQSLKLEEAVARAEAAEDEILRMAADFQNARKRLDRLSQDQTARAKEGIVTQLISVLDDLDLAEDNTPAELEESQQKWLEGILQIRGKILAVFHDEDVEPMATEGTFDPVLHEAVQMLPSEEHESGQIVETLRKGYTRGDKVLRPAMVRIAQ